MISKCAKCKCTTKKVSDANKLFMDKYLITDPTVYACPNCGEEYLDSCEYERIRKKIGALEPNLRSVQEVLAKVKFLVL